MKHWCKAILILCLLSGGAQAATVYKKVDENGNLIFSDTPMDDAETLDVPPVPTMKIDKVRPITSPVTEPKKKPPAYKSVTITAPQQDEHFINNQGMVTISVQVLPGLQPKHQLELLLNGVKRAGPSASTTFSFSNLDRGSYSAQAQVVDDKGNVLISSPAITFHVKRSFVRN